MSFIQNIYFLNYFVNGSSNIYMTGYVHPHICTVGYYLLQQSCRGIIALRFIRMALNSPIMPKLPGPDKFYHLTSEDRYDLVLFHLDDLPVHNGYELLKKLPSHAKHALGSKNECFHDTL
jgi:hypothetical protein